MPMWDAHDDLPALERATTEDAELAAELAPSDSPFVAHSSAGHVPPEPGEGHGPTASRDGQATNGESAKPSSGVSALDLSIREA